MTSTTPTQEHRHVLSLSDGQKRKLRIAYKKRRSVIVGLSNRQLSSSPSSNCKGDGGGEQVILNERQHKMLTKAVKNHTGVRLALSYDQLVKNREGGLLKEMLELVENTVPGGKTIISPLVRNNLAPLLKDHFIPWLKSLIDNELDTIITTKKGAGLTTTNTPNVVQIKRRIKAKLNSLLPTATKKKNTTTTTSAKTATTKKMTNISSISKLQKRGKKKSSSLFDKAAAELPQRLIN